MPPTPSRTRLTLTRRLSAGFGALLLILLALTALALQRMDQVGELMQTVTDSGKRRMLAVRDMERSALRYGGDLQSMGSAPHDELTQRMQALNALGRQYQEASQRARALLDDAQALQLLDAADRAAAQTQAIMQEVDKAAEGRGEGAKAFHLRMIVTNDNAKWSGLHRQWAAATLKLSGWNDSAAHAVAEQAGAVATSARGVLIGGAVLGLLVATLTGWAITRNIATGLSQAAQAARRLADHDLATPVRVERQDEIGQVLQALDDMRLRQRELAAGVIEAAQTIHRASTEIAASSQDMSGRTEMAAATLQQVNSDIGMLADSVSQTSGAADQGQQLADTANGLARQGEQTVNQAVRTMAEVDASSSRIGEIIGLIDGIAFQTNILALNAAVEAARAGEQGRGFAVVAGEVRSLAGRTAAAAREVKQLIQDSRDKVAAGSQQVHLAGDSTQQVLGSVGDVARIIETISTGASAQLGSIGQTRDAMQRLDQVVQQNAAMAEETAAATSALTDQAQRLTALVERFRLTAA